MADHRLSETASDAVEALLDQVTTETQPAAELETVGLRGQVAIVTGGSSGIGRAVLLELARSGVHIGFCFLDESAESRDDARAVAKELCEMEVGVFYRSCDVRQAGDVSAFVEEVRAELGGLHILVNNAGIGRDRALWHMKDHEWEAVLRTNLDGSFYFIRAVAPFMRAQEHGKIVNVTSVHGIRSEFGIAIGLTESAAIELGPKNINVNAVAPGYIRTTRLTAGVLSEVLDHARERSPLGRLGDPKDVAGVVLFLCSETARHITGVTIPVDGGYLL
jgi:3-oxoacyl-[acyl-carrier protein] reductase